MRTHQKALSCLGLMVCWLIFGGFPTSVTMARAAAASLPIGPNGLIAPSDNQHPPYMSVYKGSVSGLQNIWGITNVNAYAAWLGRRVIWAEDYQPYTWDNVEGEGGWQLPPWSIWVNAVPGRRWILGVAILPSAWDDSGPTSGSGAHVPVSCRSVHGSRP